MARVTVEDCILNVSNRFELVLIAAKRAREIAAGAPLTVLRDNDKNPVIALREISENTIPIDALRQNIIKSMRKNVFLEDYDHELDEELQSIMHESEQPWVTNKEDTNIYSSEAQEENEDNGESVGDSNSEDEIEA